MKPCSRILLGLLFAIITSCSLDEDPGVKIISFSFDFSSSTHDWVAGFADFPADSADSAFYELVSDYIEPPGSSEKAIMLSGNNHSDDLFMYIKKKITGLDPQTEYTLTIEVEFASEAKKGSIGAGGSPGESVFMKAGASSMEPKSLIENDFYVLNIDKGQQSQSGEDMVLIGDISVPSDSEGFVLVNRTNAPYANNNYTQPIIATTNSHGELWLIIGTDSGFEGVTTLYYRSVTGVLSKSN
jgi:hypothetical protein